MRLPSAAIDFWFARGGGGKELVLPYSLFYILGPFLSSSLPPSLLFYLVITLSEDATCRARYCGVYFFLCAFTSFVLCVCRVAQGSRKFDSVIEVVELVLEEFWDESKEKKSMEIEMEVYGEAFRVECLFTFFYLSKINSCFHEMVSRKFIFSLSHEEYFISVYANYCPPDEFFLHFLDILFSLNV